MQVSLNLPKVLAVVEVTCLNVTLCSVTTTTKKQQQCIYLKKYKVYNTLS